MYETGLEPELMMQLNFTKHLRKGVRNERSQSLICFRIKDVDEKTQSSGYERFDYVGCGICWRARFSPLGKESAQTFLNVFFEKHINRKLA